MKKTIFTILICGVMILGMTGCGKEMEKNKKEEIDDNYKLGDKVSVQLNNQENEIGNVVKVDGSKVQVLLQRVSTNLEYKDLEYHINAKSQSWTNVEKVNLLSVEYFFDNFELTLSHTMDGYVGSTEEINHFLFGTEAYWLSGNDPHDANCYAGNGEISNCSWIAHQGAIDLADKSYIETGFRPVVTISKEYISKEEQSNKTYKLYDKVLLKDYSEWIVLEDLGEDILLIKPKKGALVDTQNINRIVSEKEEELKKSLMKLNLDVSNLKMRIPTSKDFEKYFKLDFSNKDDDRVYGITLDSATRNITKDWEYSSFWVKNDSDYISCKTSNGQVYCSLWEIEPGEKWHVLVILQINKSNIE